MGQSGVQKAFIVNPHRTSACRPANRSAARIREIKINDNGEVAGEKKERGHKFRALLITSR
jgi:hypothetical protein